MLSGISIICFAACYAIAFGAGSRRPRSRVSRGNAPRCSAIDRRPGSSPTRCILANRGATPARFPLPRRRMAAAGRLGAGGRLSWPRCSICRAAPTGLVLLPIVLGLIVGSHWASTEPLAPERSFYVWAMFHGIVLLARHRGRVRRLSGRPDVPRAKLRAQARPLAGQRLAAAQPRMAGARQQPHARPLGRADRARLRLRPRDEPRRSTAAKPRTRCGPTRSCSAWPRCSLWLVAAEVFRLVYPAARRGRKVAYLTLASFVFLDHRAGFAHAARQRPRRIVAQPAEIAIHVDAIRESAVRNPTSLSHEHSAPTRDGRLQPQAFQPGGPRAARLHAGANGRRPGRLARHASRDAKPCCSPPAIASSCTRRRRSRRAQLDAADSGALPGRLPQRAGRGSPRATCVARRRSRSCGTCSASPPASTAWSSAKRRSSRK